MSNKLISVIIPAYNVESYIEECIKSILNQSHKNMEILIYNDGSTDNTLNVLKKFKKLSKLKIFSCRENKGVSAARNYLLNRAQGDYIMLQDADDKSFKNRAEECLKFLKNSEFIFTSCNIETSQGAIFKSSIKDQFLVAIQQFGCRKPLGGASSFFNRQIIDEGIRYDENLLAGEDLFFDVEVQGKFPLKITGFPFDASYYWYRKREGSLTALRREKELTPQNILDKRNRKIKKIMSKVLLDNKEKFLSYFEKEPSLYSNEIRNLYKENNAD